MPKPGKSSTVQYIALGLFFAFAATYQTWFLMDLWRDFTFRYTAPPFELGSPWPTVTGIYGDTAIAADIQLGDRIISIDGQSLDGFSDLYRPVRLKKPGDSIEVIAERNGSERKHVIPLTSVRSKSIDWLIYVHAGIMLVLLPIFCILLGFGVVAVRPKDPMAWLLLLMLVSLSQNSFSNVSAQGWPSWLRIPSHIYRGLGSVLPACMLLFGIYFTHRWRVDARFPWIKWFLLAPLLAFTAFSMMMHVGLSESYRTVEPLVDLNTRRQTAGMIATLIGVGMFFLTIGWKSRDPAISKDARRRLQLLLWGAAVSLVPISVVMIFILIYGFGGENLWTVLAIMMTFLFPVTMAHVIVVHQAMDVRVAIRQGVQYAFARGGVLVLQIIVSAAVIVFVTILAGSQDIQLPVRMAAVGLAVASIFLVRKLALSIGDWVDRRFFREAYKTDAVLSDLSEDVRAIVETRPLLETVAERLSSTLHVPKVAMLIARNGHFEPAYAIGYGAAPDVRFPDRGGAIAQLERENKPVRLNFDDETSWVNRHEITGEERRQLGNLDAQLLLPLMARERLLGFISLGKKRSEEPYSSTDVRLLRSVASQTGLALENSQLATAVAQEIAQRELFNRELEIAREVQQRLFPQSAPQIEGLEYAGTCRPARGIGGDYYDFLALPEGSFGAAVGDVSGKGIPAALLMASLQASLRGQTVRGASDLADLMASVNRLIHDASSANRYATFFYAQYTPSNRLLNYVNAGHNAPIVRRGEEVLRLETGGPVVGLFRDANYEQGSIELQPGDLIALFTDGISESMNSADEEWGEENLIAAAKDCRERPASEIMDRLIAAADEFAAGAPQHDE